MSKKILARTIIEVLGKPQEHVETAIKGYVQNLKEDERYHVVREEYAEIKKQEKHDLWAGFVELELQVEKMEDIISFCFDYMPSLIEILEPEELTFEDVDVSHFLNDLQAKLHAVDMVAKQMKVENEILQKSVTILLRNYILFLLKNANFSSTQLSQLTGVEQNRLEDFLDQLIDEGKINLKEGVYYIPSEKLKEA
ncbi:MAG: hypothetical protein AABX37_04685 [Nanoarchaeota archaeon]